MVFIMEEMSNLVRPLRHLRNFQKRSFVWFKLNDVPSLVMDQVRTLNLSARVATYVTGNSVVGGSPISWLVRNQLVGPANIA